MYVSDAAQKPSKIQAEKMPLDGQVTGNMGKASSGQIYTRLRWGVKRMVCEKRENVYSFLVLEV